MLKVPESVQKMFGRPAIIFTVAGNKASEAVIAELKKQTLRRPKEELLGGAQYVVFADMPEAMRTVVDKTAAVALSDGPLQHSKRFTPLLASRQHDHPICGVQWVVQVTPMVLEAQNGVGGCANQIYADFVRNFDARLGANMFPWGKGRGGDYLPSAVTLPFNMTDIVRRLNDGPDLARSIAAEKFALELPPDSRISWIRVLPEALVADADEMAKMVNAFSQFEIVSNDLCRSDTEVQELLLSGVDLAPDSAVRDCYIHPPTSQFSMRRPDLHFTGVGVFASENDEMPGGLPELFHLDNVYGTNQESWQRALKWLTSEGTLLFVVSHDWSKPYILDTTWFTAELRKRGFDTRMITTDRIDELSVRPDGVYDSLGRIGTIWRQFPIFETTGMLAELVLAAREGVVRMVPEFGHWGNKSWFSIFRTHEDFYRRSLDSATFAVLNEILPDSRLVRSEDDFPFSIGPQGYEVSSLSALKRLPVAERNLFVLKVAGANNLAARMYGVLMGSNLTDEVWSDWIEERFHLRQPFIMQTRLHTSVVRLPVMNTKRACPELFSCRVMVRPYMLNGEVVSSSATAVPSFTERVHGMVDMALGPVILK